MEWQRGLWWFLVPSFSVLAVVLLWPLGYAVYLSLFDYYLGSSEMRFVGLANYTSLLAEPRFWSSLATTLLIALSAVGLEFVVGLALALALYGLTSSARVFTVLLFLPHIVTPVVAALFLKWIFAANWGLFDATALALNLSPPDWLGDPFWAKVTVILADAWQFTPFMMLVLYAALQTLDQALFEAARIDGATGLQVLWHIILPALRPVILFAVAVRLMDAFRFFDSIYVLTGGGPGTATETITMYTYQLAFRLLQVGKASALGVLTLLFVAVMVALLAKFLQRSAGEVR